ncbi:FAD/NAD(P)-binding domain-containing protein [Suillus subaureus]|uniref:FAD/NAD(P)-binding domain-containing protein n=1 Tax=Suillus subaureus TaxID=48587 RepID=A0A9P7EKN4_9AGAM|nr:FAD/NAD(P)-binding domain-containing protein [Suillus subaureus]KAG1823707.1 FAD/NAD(P)-binding domain-containing protein [Suillus subaureus]
MSLPDNSTVLIVGAGPSGLAAALSLIHHGCRDFVIVDAIVEGQNVSRAITIHSATVEALASINAVDVLLSRAIKGKSIRITSRDSQIFEAKFDPLKKHSAYPYALFVPQNVTELVLVQKLQSFGVQVQRPHRVIGMKQNEQDPHITDVSFEDGQVIKARYIIGADGARSTIRTVSGIGFSDPEGPNPSNHLLAQMVSADVTFEPEPVGPLTIEGHLNGTASTGNLFVLTPLGSRFNDELTRDGKPISKPIFRIDCAVPLKNGEPPRAPPKEYIQDLIDTYGPACITSVLSLNPTPVKIDQLIWSTRFRTHSAIADRTFTRLGAAIFLVGDAAHIHSPAGGQGMNLSIRDAIFLSEVVTKHIQASAENPDVGDTILQEFAEARHARALEIIGFTKNLLKFASLTYNTYAWWMPFSRASARDLVLRILGRFDFMQSMVAWDLSGLGRR